MRKEGDPEGHELAFDAEGGVWYWLDFAGSRREVACPEGFKYDAQGVAIPKRGHEVDQVSLVPEPEPGAAKPSPERTARKAKAEGEEAEAQEAKPAGAEGG